MGFLICSLIVIAIFGGIRLQQHKEKKKQGYLMKIYANIYFLHGYDLGKEVSVKLYEDRIVFNDTATIKVQNITNVDYIKQFVRPQGGRRYYNVLPYHHQLTFNYKPKDGGETFIRLERPGKLSPQFIEFRRKILLLKGIKEEPFQPPSEPYDL